MAAVHKVHVHDDLVLADIADVRSQIHVEPIPEANHSAKLEEENIRREGEKGKILLESLARREAHRVKYTPRLFWTLVGWLACLLVLIFLDALEFPILSQFIQFNVPESVLIALISGATINVFAVFYPIVRDLFPPRARPDDDDGH